MIRKLTKAQRDEDRRAEQHARLYVQSRIYDLENNPSLHPGRAPRKSLRLVERPKMVDLTIRLPEKLAEFIKAHAESKGWKVSELGHYVTMLLFTNPEIQAGLSVGEVETETQFHALVNLFIPPSVSVANVREHVRREFTAD